MALKHWQISGAEWLAPKRHALLAYGMRVGKTLTALKAAKLADANRTLIVCPAVARHNWAVNVGRSFGRVSVVETAGQLAHEEGRSPGPGVVITSYGLIPSSEEAPWDLVIADESHYLKAPTAARARRVLGQGGLIHRTDKFWALSGTPATNHAAEMWTLLRAVGIYRDSYEAFVREFCSAYRNERHDLVITGSRNQAALRALIGDFMLRVTLRDVLPDLPPIDYEDYVLSGPRPSLPSDEVRMLEAACASREPMAALQAVEPATATLRRLLGEFKAPLAADLIADELDAEPLSKIVLFAVHITTVSILAAKLGRFYPAVVNGPVTPSRRSADLDRFQNDPDCRVFIGNIQSAGTAIDLSVASEGVFVESSYVPGENEQAAMRLQNMNRTNKVSVRFLSLGGTLDERIQRTCRRKAEELRGIFDRKDTP